LFVAWLTRRRVQRPQRIAVPKLGNVSLACAVARRLKLAVVVVRNEGLSPLRGDQFEGHLQRGEHIWIIDDVGSDGTFFLQITNALQKAGAVVTGILVAIDRTEGDAAQKLSQRGLDYHYLLQVNDADLKSLLTQAA
jgi:orotate phosphoribosyltransferase